MDRSAMPYLSEVKTGARIRENVRYGANDWVSTIKYWLYAHDQQAILANCKQWSLLALQCILLDAWLILFVYDGGVVSVVESTIF